MDENNAVVPGFDDDKDESLSIRISPVPAVSGGCVVELTGFIDTYNSSFFQRQITKLICADYVNLIFDCSNLSAIASTGFGVLTNLLKMVHVSNGEIVLSTLQPAIMETIELLGFSHFFKIAKDPDSALKCFGNASSAVVSDNVFPKMLNCPSCQKSLRAQHAGRFRCMNCKTIIVISPEGNISTE